MGLFRKRKIEEINLEIKETKFKEIDEDIQLYSEKNEYEKDKLRNLDLASKKNIVWDEYNKLQKKNYELLNNYYICKIFSRVALKDKDYNLQMMAMDKHINRVRKEYEDLQKQVNIVKYNEGVSEDEIFNTYEKVKEIFLFHKGIQTNFDDLRRKYFNYLKIATVNVCMNKSNYDLENMYKNLSNFLNEYKNLNEAAEFIYYNSGVLIVQMINSLVTAISGCKNHEHIKTYNYKYFLKSEVVITLDVTEWIDIYNKIKFVLKSETEIINNLEFKNNYQKFEMRYLILMMYMETNKKGKQIVNFNM